MLMRRINCGRQLVAFACTVLVLAAAGNARGQSDSTPSAKAADSKGPEGKSKGPVVNDYNYPQVRQINQHIRQVWVDNQLSPSPHATDGEWCRRVYLDIIGRIPSVQELRAY